MQPVRGTPSPSQPLSPQPQRLHLAPERDAADANNVFRAQLATNEQLRHENSPERGFMPHSGGGGGGSTSTAAAGEGASKSTVSPDSDASYERLRASAYRAPGGNEMH